MICIDRVISGLLGATIALMMTGMDLVPIAILAVATTLQITRDTLRQPKEIYDD